MIGKGGSSKVYRAMGPDLNNYAIKLVSLEGTEETLNLYLNEINHLKRLKGRKTIIELIDAEVKQEEQILAMVRLMIQHSYRTR